MPKKKSGSGSKAKGKGWKGRKKGPLSLVDDDFVKSLDSKAGLDRLGITMVDDIINRISRPADIHLPDTEYEKGNTQNKLKKQPATVRNVASALNQFGVKCRFNMQTKRMEFVLPDDAEELLAKANEVGGKDKEDT